MRFKIILCLILFFLLSFFAFGQKLPEKTKNKSQEIKQAAKIDEFGDISEKEFTSKLKNFFEILRKNKSHTGYLVFYNDFNSTPFRKTQYFANAKLKSYAKYLSRGFDPPRIVFILGGLRNKVTTELWIVPEGEEILPKADSLDFAKDEKYKLETLGIENINLDEAKLNKEVGEEDIQSEDYAEGLTEILSRNKTWRAVLYLYADKEEYDVQKSRQMIENKLKKDFKTSNVDLNRVEIVFGGYKPNPQIEIWIVPKNGMEPQAMPDEKIEEIKCLTL